MITMSRRDDRQDCHVGIRIVGNASSVTKLRRDTMNRDDVIIESQLEFILKDSTQQEKIIVSYWHLHTSEKQF